MRYKYYRMSFYKTQNKVVTLNLCCVIAVGMVAAKLSSKTGKHFL